MVYMQQPLDLILYHPHFAICGSNHNICSGLLRRLWWLCRAAQLRNKIKKTEPFLDISKQI